MLLIVFEESVLKKVNILLDLIWRHNIFTIKNHYTFSITSSQWNGKNRISAFFSGLDINISFIYTVVINHNMLNITNRHRKVTLLWMQKPKIIDHYTVSITSFHIFYFFNHKKVYGGKYHPAETCCSHDRLPATNYTNNSALLLLDKFGKHREQISKALSSI